MVQFYILFNKLYFKSKLTYKVVFKLTAFLSFLCLMLIHLNPKPNLTVIIKNSN